MARLVSLIRKGVPVPVTQTPNRRSLLYLGNMLSAVTTYLSNPSVPTGKTWLIADGEDWSTEQLVQEIALAMGLKAHTIRLPGSLLRSTAAVGSLLRRVGLPVPWTKDVLKKLLGDFFVDATAIQCDLDWSPPYTPAEGLARTFSNSPLEARDGSDL
jgi:nucleoside-diphosphate-sugar epimerase